MKVTFAKKLTAVQVLGMPATIQVIISCLRVSSVRIKE